MKAISPRFIVSGFLMLLISGCGYEKQALSAEFETHKGVSVGYSQIDSYLERPILDVADYAFRISDNYKKIGDGAATNRDAFAAAVIVAVSAASLGAINHISSEEVSSALLAGGVAYQTGQYVKPDSAAAAFYTASQRAMCIGSKIVQISVGQPSVDAAATAVALSYVRKSELALRSSLSRTIPDPKTLADDLASLARPAVEDGGRDASFSERMDSALQACF
ncbi:MAG: hypothetical protein KDK08_20525 [Rhizobiaceae bacterium]|nr:hypothetical protein [Rhizobiaceae bacterium]